MSEQYIMMVLALPNEFFEGWVFKNGDSIIVKESAEWNEYHIGEYIAFDGIVGTIDGWECSFEEENNDIRPLPSQRQLQEILLNEANSPKYKWQTPRTYRWLAITYMDWIRDHYEETKNSTLEEMWLFILMGEIYKKRWNGNAWV